MEYHSYVDELFVHFPLGQLGTKRKHNLRPCVLAAAAITNYHRMWGLNNRNVFSQVLEVPD